MRILAVGVGVPLFGAPANGQPVKSAASCEALTSLTLAHVTVEGDLEAVE